MPKLTMTLLVSFVLAISGQAVMAGQIHYKPYLFKSDSGKTVQAQWGTFDVPLKHDVKNGKTLELSFVRFKSTNPHPDYPIVYLAGGPGGSGIEAARGKRFPMFMALRKVADVIVLDQRGTGASNSIPDCTASKPFPVESPLTRTTETAYLKSVVQHCVGFWQGKGIDLSAYNTRENALDLESLRTALGVKKLNLLGISYGSTLALAALRVMPRQIAGVVLASPLDVYQTLRLPERTQDFLKRVAGLLRTDPRFKHAYPDLLGSMRTVLARLAKKPAQIRLPMSSGGKPATITLGKFAIQWLSVSLLKDPRQLRYLPLAYAAMAAGQFQLLAGQLYQLLTRPPTLSGMPLAVRAASCVSPERAQLVEHQAGKTLLGDALNLSTSMMRTARLKRLNGAFCQPVVSKVPALVLTGTLDGRTYPAGHAEILKTLPKGSEVVIENAGHDLFMSSPRVVTDIVEFLSHQPVKYRNISLPVPNFVTPDEMKRGRGGAG